VTSVTGPRFHSAPLHRPESAKTGCPDTESAKAFALTTPPKSVRPLALRASRWPDACPPPIRRQSLSHPDARSRNIAAPRPDLAGIISLRSIIGKSPVSHPNTRRTTAARSQSARPLVPTRASSLDKLRAGLAQGVQIRGLRTTPVTLRVPPRYQGIRCVGHFPSWVRIFSTDQNRLDAATRNS
jgi:hypothetical protein